ncbi:MAG: DUF4286 family protein [Bacteroidia bacterium]|jgi:hypothetical protein
MIIYNVTINIEDDVHLEWVEWMKNEHIPRVMATGYFLDNRMCRLMVEEETGTSYTIQYTLKNMADYEEYQSLHAPALQKEVLDKYRDKFVAFRSLMEVV